MKEHKTFKPYDRVLVRKMDIDDYHWFVDLYSHYSTLEKHCCVGATEINDSDILPYEGNEHLLGTDFEPEERVELKEGEWVMVSHEPNVSQYKWSLRRVAAIHESTECFIVCDQDNTPFRWKYVIRFSDFNPNDMEATKAKILCVRNGRIVRYKSK